MPDTPPADATSASPTDAPPALPAAVPADVPADPEVDAAFEDLLAFLHDSRGVDFAGYKRASLRRLVERRQQAAQASDVRDYLDRLQVDPAEVGRLFDGLLINVTSFFRDPDAWQGLRDTLLPSLLAVLPEQEPIRLWSAACATGQEAYSLAMLLHDLLGDQAYRQRVKVYATDIDEAALAVARSGRYPVAALTGLTPEQQDTYFPGAGQVRAFRSDLRQNIIFGRHDLLSDAPIGRVALLTCRNALMYFTAETQARVLERFAFALHDHGLLMLGRAEMLLTYNDLFSAVDLPHRIFRPSRRPASIRFAGAGPDAQARELTQRRLTTISFHSGGDPVLVLGADGAVAAVNDAAVRRLGVAQADVGRAFSELDLSFRPVELRPAIADALAQRVVVDLPPLRWAGREARESWWQIRVQPLLSGDAPAGVQISFVDATREHVLMQELAGVRADWETANEELQSSSEELETTNEELQSAVEELQTTNEELQSTNEELETMNEELQSTNEELQTVNDELRDRTGELAEVNAFLESVLSGLRSAIIVVDADHKVLVWNTGAEQLWGLRAYEAEGHPLSALDGPVPSPALMACLASVLVPGRAAPPESLLVTSRLGGQLLLTLAASPLRDRSGQVRGAILTMDAQPVPQT